MSLLIGLVATAAAVSIAACVGDDPAGAPITPGTEASTDSAPPADSDTTPEADSGSPQDAAPDAPLRFCQTQTPVVGIADFFCADFDGTSAAEGFTGSVVPDGGALDLTTDIFFSPPASLTTKQNAHLKWEKSGATPFTEISLQARINVGTSGGVVPPSTGYVSIFELKAPGSAASLALHYTQGRTVDQTANYVGYYVEFTACPSACALLEKKVGTSLPLSVWTNVELAWTKSGTVKLTYNSVDVLNVSLEFTTTSTVVGAEVGLQASANPPLMPRHSFDNVIINVKRE